MADVKWPETVTLYSDPRRIAVLTTVLFVFAGACAVLLETDIFDEPHHDVLATTILVIGLLLFGSFVALGLCVIRHPNRLVLDATGVSVKVLWIRQFIPWEDVSRAVPYLSGYVRSLALILTPEGALRRAKGAYFAPMNVRLGKGWKSDHTYSPHELAVLINIYLTDFRLASKGDKPIG